mmetsp:Transcript_37789/g.95800  ORF Transcript_37789/g.95800 Transcript_37789/m.95800 type:complete len:169 (-) Transcript_37789:615-1121(-)
MSTLVWTSMTRLTRMITTVVPSSLSATVLHNTAPLGLTAMTTPTLLVEIVRMFLSLLDTATSNVPLTTQCPNVGGKHSQIGKNRRWRSQATQGKESLVSDKFPGFRTSMSPPCRAGPYHDKATAGFIERFSRTSTLDSFALELVTAADSGGRESVCLSLRQPRFAFCT